jgi:hypothetical protein
MNDGAIPDGTEYWWGRDAYPRKPPKRKPCDCRVPRISLRPNGKRRHGFCIGCSGVVDEELANAIADWGKGLWKGWEDKKDIAGFMLVRAALYRGVVEVMKKGEGAKDEED